MAAYLRALRFAIRQQASAYGFTLVVWGTGALASSQIGPPDPLEVVAFVGGALISAVTIVAIAFGVWTALGRGDPQRRAYSAMHLPSVPAAIAAGWLPMLFLGGSAAYFTAAFLAVLVYEAILSLEIGIALTEHSLLEGDSTVTDQSRAPRAR
jgi:hypothetical protein